MQGGKVSLTGFLAVLGIEHGTSPLWQLLQVLAESKAQTVKAQLFLAQIKGAYPEVLRAIKTTQLAQELLLYKEEMLQEIGETGAGYSGLLFRTW
jgi:hypothetical protein